MKILFINTGPWGTGSFTLIKCLAKELVKLGHEVKIFFPDANVESIDKEEYYSNPALYYIWNFPIKTSISSIHTFPLMITDPHPRNPEAITFKVLSDKQLYTYEHELHRQLLPLIHSFKPDIIECHHIWYPCWLLHQMGLDYIVTAHHSDQMGFRYDPNVQKKAIDAANGAKKIIAISESVKKEVIELYHVNESKIVVLANGYDETIFKPKEVNREEILHKLGINIPFNARIIDFAGKLSLTKGIDILLQANKLLDSSMNIHIIVMGSGEIKNIIEGMNIDSYSLENIHFIGHQSPEGVADIHHISYLSVLPSRSEGFGISCLEAMGCGLPMVVSRSGGPEYFAVGKIIDSESAQQLADGIMELLKIPDIDYQKLCKKALSVARRYTSPAITQQHLKLFREVLLY
ncbi:glycosyltransferase family 4 protein [Legionella spiritensis]|uniref:glycosyltransferase family 4 protein n=1 Tax=Legionella spiritensis TaxID=452 RepID=UPI000F70E18E|nr:glycosyltransferase family 4 protein [Legionella spiritensis]VEG92490.1 putative Starch synthase [Legionella spiritensis]